MGSTDLKITLEFGAGAELLFGNIKRREVTLPPTQKWNIKNLLKWMHENILTERPELFIQDDTVRPGILVLINDTDWELLVTIVKFLCKLYWFTTFLHCRENWNMNYNKMITFYLSRRCTVDKSNELTR
ncbi:hypothetical protein DOY81_001241 [Sarcophaga bullata]|nr:hypothetical protein DOY81_001241 [Sarcophaga bullata]